MSAFHANLEAWAHRQWSHRGLFAWLLSPLSLLFLAITRSRKKRIVPQRLDVPVIVVGNIYVGGTGKTPVTIALVRELQARGWRPGIVSRGFGRKGEKPAIVGPDSQAANVGDEPLLIYRETGVPIAVGQDRYRAGIKLLEAHPEINLIVSDDGLQHLQLARDFEIAVVGARGLGNGWVLPAGPLREPPSRLDTVDAIVLNTTNEAVVESRTPRFAASSCFGVCTQLSTGATARIDELSERIKIERLNPLAAAGIAAPGRFFAMVRGHDIICESLELGDHFDFSFNPFADRKEDIIFITGKDAVKCAVHPELSKDDRLWVIGLEVRLDPYLIDFIDQAARKAREQLASDSRTS